LGHELSSRKKPLEVIRRIVHRWDFRARCFWPMLQWVAPLDFRILLCLWEHLRHKHIYNLNGSWLNDVQAVGDVYMKIHHQTWWCKTIHSGFNTTQANWYL
jgi:hypothetical protein